MTVDPDVGFGVYVHWPYCARICPYCDFNVVRDRGRVAEKAALVDAIIADLAATAAMSGPRALTSIFFGGGTPSLMEPEQAARIIDAARELWAPAPGLEITLEANPTDAETTRFAAFAAAGVNRLSLGVQSLNDDALRLLGRNHDARAARAAVDSALEAVARVSIDLIYALPDQDLTTWRSELAAVAASGVEHVSTYQLTIEAGTAFDRAVKRGLLTPLAEDPAAEAYALTEAALAAEGFDAYEVSNHAKGPAARARHNLTYWRGEDYVGVGPGAHGRLTVNGRRRATTAPMAVGDYLAQIGGSIEAMSARDVALERLLMGLRTDEGVALADLTVLQIPAATIDSLYGFVVVDSERMHVTRKGRAVLDYLLGELAACEARAA